MRLLEKVPQVQLEIILDTSFILVSTALCVRECECVLVRVCECECVSVKKSLETVSAVSYETFEGASRTVEKLNCFNIKVSLVRPRVAREGWLDPG